MRLYLCPLGNKVRSSTQRNNQDTDPLLELSIYCVTALCTKSYWYFPSKFYLSKKKIVFRTVKCLWHNSFLCSTLCLYLKQTTPKWSHTGKWNGSGQRVQYTDGSDFLVPIWTTLSNKKGFDKEHLSHC